MRESLKWIVIYIWYHLGLNSVLHFGQTYVFDTIITYKTINKTNTGTAIKYQGTSKWLPNQFTWQDESIRVEISKNKETNTFFIIAPPFRYYYSILWGRLQEEMKHSLREYEAEALRLLWSTRFARVKRSAMLFLREPKARFIGQSPASFFMRVSALHFQAKEHCSRSALLFEMGWQKNSNSIWAFTKTLTLETKLI